ncbi:MAG: ligase-associated DNA damage response endonuclease PdeM [Xanthobacteraceae bacterium]|nr:ligase-associated DNA damage response endonuclease PdeM [Xanthobacteraceae bacterium]
MPAPGAEIIVAGVSLLADLAGALYWPEEGALIVSDLHLEKGSAFAVRGVLMPPYDTATTLEALGMVIARYAPRMVIALGDNFHDGGGPARLAAADRAQLLALQRGRDWVWIAGNHDPDPREGIGGVFARALALGPLSFRHEPTAGGRRPMRNANSGTRSGDPKCPGSGETFAEALGETCGEIAGHLHPAARIHQRGRTQTRKCFATDGERLVMPAFGAFTGGLNIRNAAFLKVFGALGFTAHLIGHRRLYSFAAARCLAD